MKFIRHVLFLSIVLTAISPLAGNAANEGKSHTIPLHKEEKKHKDHDRDTFWEGRRSPYRPVIACISEFDGCIVADVDNNDILSYEAYDENGECIGVFYDNMQFASFVLSQSGLIEIRLELEEYLLVGFIEI